MSKLFAFSTRWLAKAPRRAQRMCAEDRCIELHPAAFLATVPAMSSRSPGAPWAQDHPFHPIRGGRVRLEGRPGNTEQDWQSDLLGDDLQAARPMNRAQRTTRRIDRLIAIDSGRNGFLHPAACSLHDQERRRALRPCVESSRSHFLEERV